MVLPWRVLPCFVLLSLQGKVRRVRELFQYGDREGRESKKREEKSIKRRKYMRTKDTTKKKKENGEAFTAGVGAS